MSVTTPVVEAGRRRKPDSKATRRRSSRAAAASAVISVLASAPPGVALAAEECESFAAIETAPLDACASIFVAAPPISVEELWHELGLVEVVAQDHAIELVYRGELDEPSAISFVDLELIDTERRDGCPPVGLVEIVTEAESDRCAPGMYVVNAGVTLGADGRVVAVLDDHLLVVWHGALRVLSIAEVEPPLWRLIWYPPWRLSPPRAPTPAPPPPRPGRRR